MAPVFFSVSQMRICDCIVYSKIADNRVCVERPERCLSISYLCKVAAVGQSQFPVCSYSRTLRQSLWLSVKQIGPFLHLAPRYRQLSVWVCIWISGQRSLKGTRHHTDGVNTGIRWLMGDLSNSTFIW